MSFPRYPEYKDSGVEWLGEVPARWTLTKLEYSASRIIDCPHETPTYCPDGDFMVVRTADVGAGVLDLSNAYRLDEDEYLKRTRRRWCARRRRTGGWTGRRRAGRR